MKYLRDFNIDFNLKYLIKIKMWRKMRMMMIFDESRDECMGVGEK